MLCTRVPSAVHSKASAEGRGDLGAHFVCSLSLLDPCPAFSVFHSLKQWLPVLSSFLVPSRSSLHLCIRLDYFNCKLFIFLLGTKAPLYLCLWWSEGPLRLPPPARSDTSVTWTLLPGFAAGAVWEKWAPLAMSRSLRVCPEVDPSPYLWGSSVATPCPPTPCLLPSFLQDFLLFYCFQGKSVLNHLRAAACQVSRSLLRM